MILRNSAILAFFSIISLLLGIVRDRLLATVVGVGPVLDVYNAAFRIPDFIYGLFFAVVSAQTVVPFITKHMEEGDEELKGKFNSLFFFFGVMLVSLAIAVVAILPFIAPFVVPGFDEAQRRLFVIASSFLMLQPLFLGLSALISSLAQVRHRFVLYSVAPLVYTFVIILSIPSLYPHYGVLGIIGGVVAGAFISLVVQSYTLYESRMKLTSSLFSWNNVREHLRVAIPRSLSTATSRLRDLVFASIATTLGVGVLSVYLFAQRIIDAFMQVVVQSAATASLPLLAHKHAKGEHAEYSQILKRNLASIFMIAVAASFVIILFKDPIVRILYGSTDRAGDIARMAQYFAYVLPLYALNMYFVSAFSASKDTMGLFYTNALATVMGIGVLLYSRHEGKGIFSLVYASWAVSASYFLLLVVFYSRKRRLSSAS